MNPALIKTEFLATGQSAPFTGQWINTSLCKNGLIVIYSSGSATNIELQAKTAITQNAMFLAGGAAEAVPFYVQSGVGPGYGAPIFFDSPISEMRLAVASGSAPLFAYITYQN